MNEYELTRAFILGKISVIKFRQLFMPAPENEECTPAPFQHEWSDILLNGTEHFVIEAFRESGKSTILKSFIQHCLVYPEQAKDYIMIVMSNADAAEKRLKEISSEYLSHPVLSANVDKVIRDTGKVFEVDVKDFTGNLVNVRIEAHGKGSKGIRGALYKSRRPRLVIIDDPQSIEDSQSDITLKHDEEWFLSDVYFLGQTTRIFMIGNNLGARCLVERAIERSEELGFKWKRIPILDENEQSNWSSKWTTEKIIAEREAFKNMGKLDVWYREKMCISMSPEMQIFKRQYFRYYRLPEIDRNALSIYILTDVALPDELQKGKSDYSVVLTMGVNSDKQWFILDIAYGRWTPFDFMDILFKKVAEYRPINVGLEVVAFQKVMKYLFNEEMVKRQIFFTIKELDSKNKKELRISTLQPRFVTGTIWFLEQAGWLTELEIELEHFTLKGNKGVHDDLIDALAYAEQVAVAPVSAFSKVKDADIPCAGAL
jgi:predicted phage terminase large subunit-like protein